MKRFPVAAFLIIATVGYKLFLPIFAVLLIVICQFLFVRKIAATRITLSFFSMNLGSVGPDLFFSFLYQNKSG
jgi:hypothetical protein